MADQEETTDQPAAEAGDNTAAENPPSEEVAAEGAAEEESPQAPPAASEEQAAEDAETTQAATAEGADQPEPPPASEDADKPEKQDESPQEVTAAAEDSSQNAKPDEGEPSSEPAAEPEGSSSKETADAEPAGDEKKEEAGTEEAAPVTEEAAPPKEETAPTEEEAAPAKEDGPAGEEAAPAKEEEAPAEEEAAPAKEEEVPAEGDTAPAKEEEVPAKEEAAPAKEEEVPAKEEETPAKEEETPAKEEETPAKEEAAPAKEETAPVKEDAPPKEDKKEEEEMKDNVRTEKVSPREDGQKEPLNLEATATVKFVLMPGGQVVTIACTLGQTLLQLKEHFSQELKMSSNLIVLMHEGKGMPDGLTLADLGVGPNGTVQLEMQSADPVNTPLKSYRPRQEYHMPDVITVRVTDDNGATKDVVVEIERATRKKPFLGGFRHKSTGVEYHNASAQTQKPPRPPPTVTRYCRDAQTEEQKHQRQQTTNDMSTQMTKIGVYVSNVQDKLIIPQKYFTADENAARTLRSVIIMQKYYRRWLAKKYVNKLKRDKQARLEWERLEEIRKRKEKEDRVKREFERRMNPKSKEDFDLLYAALEKWRLEELERINEMLTGAERKAALCMLLDQETQLLSAIDRHRVEAQGENKQRFIQSFLEKAASPKKWKGFDGNYTYMDTPYTIRAKELRDIYNSINMKYLTQDERLDVLLTLKHTVKEHDCKLTQEIIELIDREADLLMRGVREANLEGLRRRISTLFLQYIKTPTFNPEATRLLKVPQDPSTLRKNIHFCSSCNRYLPSVEFPLSSNSSNVGKCRLCAKVANDGRERQDFSKFRFMLKSLRRTEEGYKDGSQIAFLLQERDLRYLVENIWNAQSILSAWDDMYDLVFVRWDKHEEWSPWNCILITKDEAAAHERLEALEEGYGQVFVQKVKQKHTLARNYFARLPGMAEMIRKKAGQRDMGTHGPSVSGRAVPVQP